MTLVAKIDGVTLPDGALLINGAPNSNLPGGIAGLASSAWYGEAPQSGLILDDPDGDLDGIVTLEGLHTLTVDETACVGKERIWSGWLTARRIQRGPYKDGPARYWDCDIIDMNWAFALMVFRAASAKRPAETDIARVAFGQASAPMAYTPVYDNGRFNVTDNPVNFDEADYVAKYPIELFASAAGTSGKNFYAYWSHADSQISFHYDLVGVGPTSTLAISNLIADSDSTTFYPFLDGSLSRDPAYKVTGILFGYKGNYAYGTRQATIDELGATDFSPTGLQRDEVYTTDRVGKLATAQALIARMLEERAIDRDTILTSIRVPASQVNLIEAGDLIDAKYTHLPGYEAGGLLPVIRRNVVPTAGRTDMYDIHLELTGAAKPSAPGGGPGTVFPPVTEECEAADITVIQSGAIDMAAAPTSSFAPTIPPTPGSLFVVQVGSFDTAVIDLPQFTLIAGPVTDADQGYAYQLFYRVVGSSDGTSYDTTETGITGWRLQYAEFTGDLLYDSVDTNDSTTDTPASPADFQLGDVNPPTDAVSLVVGGGVFGLITSDSFSGVGITGTTEIADTAGNSRPPMWMGYEVQDHPPSNATLDVRVTHGGIVRGHISAAAVFRCGSNPVDAPCLAPAQPSPDDEPVTPDPDGAETTFNTRCPFADGTLHVYIDNTDQTGAIDTYDGAAGTFTLLFAPTPTERITAFYLGR